jgi:hypothetical protein
MRFISLDYIHDSDYKYAGTIANSLSASGALWSLTEDLPCTVSTVKMTFEPAFAISQSVDEIFAATAGELSKPNPTKENLIKQIQNIPSNPDFYEEDEQPPDQSTKDDAKRFILGVSPSGLLAGADVYGYYGEVNICWETRRKKLKLVIPPHNSHRQPTLYNGQMQGGRVIESDIESNVDSKILRRWLDWL